MSADPDALPTADDMGALTPSDDGVTVIVTVEMAQLETGADV